MFSALRLALSTKPRLRNTRLRLPFTAVYAQMTFMEAGAGWAAVASASAGGCWPRLGAVWEQY